MSDPLATARYAAAIDTGGTFTDVTLFDRSSGRTWTAKTPSTPEDPSEGFMTGLGVVLDQAGLEPADLGQVFHGTTVATNLILEGKGAMVGVITTAGFKHVLEIGRQDIPRRANLFEWVKPARPVPPERVFEVTERLDATGTVLVPLDEEAVRSAARALRGTGVAAIAICFLHSFADPRHEQRAAELVREVHPEALVSVSSEVLRVFREYERTMACVLNVYVMPAVSRYVGRLQARLARAGVAAPLLVMKSNGGVTGAAEVERVPAHTALSGPAAGVVGARFVGATAGFPDVIGIDIGGTSADICLVKDGACAMTAAGRIGQWPLSLPMLDINTIGTGGGSIARVSEAGVLTVGPASAGARPGPACYGRGGEEPTVTDAHLVLGHLPSGLLGGAMPLDLARARAAIESRVARPLGLGIEEAARGILAISDNDMAGAIRVVSVERGLDPRDFALVPFGGAGPLHGGALAALLGMRTIVVPPSPGVLSALGLLVAQLRADYSQTCLQRPPEHDDRAIEAAFTALEERARQWFERERVPVPAREMQREASLRYRHQGFELTVPWCGTAVTAESTEATVEAFHALHERLYTFSQPDTPVEIVTLTVVAVGRLARPKLREIGNRSDVADARIGEQAVSFANGWRTVPVYERVRLGRGTTFKGPALVAQLDATTLVGEDERVRCDRHGNLVIERLDRTG